MKKTISLLLIFLCSFLFSQKLIPDADLNNKYGHKIYKLDSIVNSNLEKKELYSNALRWISSNFKDSRNVIEMKDESLGEVVFSGRITGNYVGSYEKRNKKVEFLAPVTFIFKCKIIVKDKKYRIIFTDLKTETTVGLDDVEPQDVSIFKDTNQYALNQLSLLVEDIIKSMSTKSDNDF